MKISDYTNSKGPGRPRSKRSHQAILIATRDILIELGIHGLSIEGVAEKAGVGKATIYRHWQSKEDLIAEAIGSLSDNIEIPDTGDAIKDFTTVLDGMVKVTNDATQSSVSAFKRVLTGLMDTPALMDIYKEQFVIPRKNVLKNIIEKGIEKDQIRQDVNVDHLIDIVGGSYFYTVLINDEPISADDWLKRIKPIIMDGIAPRK